MLYKGKGVGLRTKPITDAYEVADCWVYFKDEKEPKETGGKVFMYAGDAQALLEQQFDHKLWSRQIGGKLG